MRLICPNCDAQYEVGEGVIPPEGRDVQCSNCGHTWFQEAANALDDPLLRSQRPGKTDPQADDAPQPAAATPPGMPPTATAPGPETGALAGDFGDAPDLSDSPDDAISRALAAMARPVPDAVPPPITAPGVRADADADAADEAVPGGASPPRRNLDDAVLSVLREEAEHEARRRQAEAAPLETQQELGLSAAISKAVAAADADSRTDIAVGHGAMPGTAKSRDLLPDVDVINSTLRAKGERRGAGDLPELPPAASERRRGFGLGFGTVLALAMLAFAIYALAPQIGSRIPAAQAALNAYVGGIDTLRSKVDAAMKSTVDALRDAEADAGSAPATGEDAAPATSSPPASGG